MKKSDLAKEFLEQYDMINACTSNSLTLSEIVDGWNRVAMWRLTDKSITLEQAERWLLLRE